MEEQAAAAPVVPAASTPLASETLALFYGQLAGLLKAGMPLPQALRTLSAEAGSPRFREALERAATAVENGAPPQAAFAAEEATLGGMLGRVAAASAASGRLAQYEVRSWTGWHHHITLSVIALWFLTLEQQGFWEKNTRHYGATNAPLVLATAS